MSLLWLLEAHFKWSFLALSAGWWEIVKGSYGRLSYWHCELWAAEKKGKFFFRISCWNSISLWSRLALCVDGGERLWLHHYWLWSSYWRGRYLKISASWLNCFSVFNQALAKHVCKTIFYRVFFFLVPPASAIIAHFKRWSKAKNL